MARLGELLKTGCAEAQKTNHSVRKTATKRALDAGCPPAYVAQVLGHKNVASLANYADADLDVQKAIAASTLNGDAFDVKKRQKQAETLESSSHHGQYCNVVYNFHNCGAVHLNK